MPALGFSARARKARELGMRAISLALSRPRMLLPGAHYDRRTPDGILVLQRGENPSTDYYLRPRLAVAGVAVEIADLSDPPAGSALLSAAGAESLMVVFCRYASADWLDALERVRDRLTRVALFVDDDLPAMIAAREIPAAARGKAALHFGAHVDRLDALCSELWVSTDVLAGRYPAARPRVITPLPEAAPPEVSAAAPELVVYHGTDVHDRERRFVLEVAGRVASSVPGAGFEITAGAELGRAAGKLSNLRITPQLAWPDYLAAQRGRQAAISLAPLFPSALNDARAPVKVFDAARLGAAGIYADAPAYRGFVRDGEDGLVLPMDPQAWADAIAALLRDPARRSALAGAARRRLIEMGAKTPRFPPSPDE
jgi:hypothetical protein